ncbi:DnaJ domain-containing protein [uncultured Alistipes sp.]|uniref:J domain-containing protein n=1 Tax=uncultured Alistipes sp. TaxID=538949 RepID=UPI002595C13B|nr:DnaJ domain-containing protein [uncultured Alistipes sp.]
MSNPYEILGLPEGASLRGVKKAYRLYVSKLHPDRHNGDPFFDELLKKVNEAYRIISDPNYSSTHRYSSAKQDERYSHPNNASYNKEAETIEYLKYEVKKLEAERDDLKRTVSDLQSKIRIQESLQLQIDMLQASLKMYQSTATLRENTIKSQDEEINRYQQQYTPNQSQTSNAINWLVAIIVAMIIIVLITIIK